MKKITIIFLVILFLILAVKLKDSFSINIGPKNVATPTSVTNSTSFNDARSGLETKESSEGSVTVAVTPLSLENSPSWDFEIVLDTHSEELTVDLVANSKLVVDSGKLYSPKSWEGDPPEGHHRKGVLKFNVLLPEPLHGTTLPKPKTIELKIKNVGGVPERSFKWNL